MQGKRGNLLLHACCAPCLTYVLEYFSTDYNISVFFYNPNIHPEDEYKKRLEGVRQFCFVKGTELFVPAYDSQHWFEYVKGLEGQPEGGERCSRCFELRLRRTSEFAKQMGFDIITTTLTVSPHKNAELINLLGNDISGKHGIKFFEADFKKKDGYKKSCELSRRYGLYRQNYCGCLYSMRL